jgi:hypothetical protein
VNYKAEGETESAVTSREKVYLSAEEWQMIKAAVNHGAAIPIDSRREVLMGYQYVIAILLVNPSEGFDEYSSKLSLN